MAVTLRGDGERRVKLRATPRPAQRSTVRVRYVGPDELRNGQPALSHPLDLRDPRP
jgi:hypothetical protein